MQCNHVITDSDWSQFKSEGWDVVVDVIFSVVAVVVVVVVVVVIVVKMAVLQLF